MIPKSNAGLKIGDTCFIPRDDGQQVPFIFVGKRKKERAHMFGALGDVVVPVPQLQRLPLHVPLREHVLVHIKCYRENDTPIVGNILDRLDEALLKRIADDIHDSGVGHITRVWGWRTLLREANRVAA